MPAVTIAILCFNQGQFVSECLRSVAAQTSSDYELIIIDNGSTDDSLDIIRAESKLFETEPLVIPSPINLGVCAALNKAMAHGTGQYFLPFAADDIMLPNRLEHQLALLNSLPSGPKILASSVTMFQGDGEIIGPYYCPNYDRRKDARIKLLRGSQPPAGGLIFDRSWFLDRGGYDERAPVEDYWFSVNVVFRHNVQIHSDRTIVARWRQHPHSFGQKKLVMVAGVAYVLASISDVALTAQERREIRLRGQQLVSSDPPWVAMKQGLQSANNSAIRRAGMRAAVGWGSRPSQRLKALFAAIAPAKVRNWDRTRATAGINQ